MAVPLHVIIGLYVYIEEGGGVDSEISVYIKVIQGGLKLRPLYINCIVVSHPPPT